MKGETSVEGDSKKTMYVGRKLVDVRGDKIGTVKCVFRRNLATGPTWLIVQTGPAGAKKVLVPVDVVVSSDDRLVAPYHKNYVMGVPAIEHEETLSEAEERRLCFRYGLDHPSSVGKSAEGCGLCRRRRRAERAQQ